MIKGSCVVCKKETELPALNDMLILTDISIPIICKDCKGEGIEPPRVINKRSRRRGSIDILL